MNNLLGQDLNLVSLHYASRTELVFVEVPKFVVGLIADHHILSTHKKMLRYRRFHFTEREKNVGV